MKFMKNIICIAYAIITINHSSADLFVPFNEVRPDSILVYSTGDNHSTINNIWNYKESILSKSPISLNFVSIDNKTTITETLATLEYLTFRKSPNELNLSSRIKILQFYIALENILSNGDQLNQINLIYNNLLASLNLARMDVYCSILKEYLYNIFLNKNDNYLLSIENLVQLNTQMGADIYAYLNINGIEKLSYVRNLIEKQNLIISQNIILRKYNNYLLEQINYNIKQFELNLLLGSYQDASDGTVSTVNPDSVNTQNLDQPETIPTDTIKPDSVAVITEPLENNFNSYQITVSSPASNEYNFNYLKTDLMNLIIENENINQYSPVITFTKSNNETDILHVLKSIVLSDSNYNELEILNQSGDDILHSDNKEMINQIIRSSILKPMNAELSEQLDVYNFQNVLFYTSRIINTANAVLSGKINSSQIRDQLTYLSDIDENTLNEIVFRIETDPNNILRTNDTFLNSYYAKISEYLSNLDVHTLHKLKSNLEILCKIFLPDSPKVDNYFYYTYLLKLSESVDFTLNYLNLGGNTDNTDDSNSSGNGDANSNGSNDDCTNNPNGPNCSISKEALLYSVNGNQISVNSIEVNTSYYFDIQIKNAYKGTASKLIPIIKTDPAAGSAFSITETTCNENSTLNLNDQCAIKVKFSPSEPIKYDTELSIRFINVNNPDVLKILLIGTGFKPIANQGPTVDNLKTEASSNIYFTQAFSGRTSTFDIQLNNTGSEIINVTNFNLSQSSKFQFININCDKISPNSNCSAKFNFMSIQEGNFSDMLLIKYHYNSSPGIAHILKVQLLGLSKPLIGSQIMSQFIQFPNIQVSSTSIIHSIGFTNFGEINARLNTIDFSRVTAFKKIENTSTPSKLMCNTDTTLAPSQTCYIDVIFSPVIADRNYSETAILQFSDEISNYSVALTLIGKSIKRSLDSNANDMINSLKYIKNIVCSNNDNCYYSKNFNGQCSLLIAQNIQTKENNLLCQSKSTLDTFTGKSSYDFEFNENDYNNLSQYLDSNTYTLSTLVVELKNQSENVVGSDTLESVDIVQVKSLGKQKYNSTQSKISTYAALEPVYKQYMVNGDLSSALVVSQTSYLAYARLIHDFITTFDFNKTLNSKYPFSNFTNMFRNLQYSQNISMSSKTDQLNDFMKNTIVKEINDILIRSPLTYFKVESNQLKINFDKIAVTLFAIDKDTFNTVFESYNVD